MTPPGDGRSGGGGSRPAGPGGGRAGHAGPGAHGRPGAGGAPRHWRLVRARRDAVPSSVRRFMQRSRQRRMRAAVPWAAATALIALAGLAAWILLGTSAFGVRQVTVTGAAIVSADQVRAAAAVPDGAPLARLDLAELGRRIGTLPAVQQATVTRDWPRGLAVRVTERTPMAAAPQGKKFVLIDRAGVAFQTVDARPADLPLARLAAPGAGDQNTRAAMQVLSALDGALRAQLVAIEVTGLARIRLELRDRRQVIWGDATEIEAKARAAAALLNRKGTGGGAERGATIDVSAPGVVTVR
jgi:cell division protein FtsQ